MGEMVFVYGTLRQGMSNHGVMRGAPLIGRATVKGELVVDGLPFLCDGDRDVVGEVYEVEPAELKRLDRFEGSPRWYQRVSREAKVDRLLDGVFVQDTLQVWLYLMPQRPVGAVLVETGDYVEYQRSGDAWLDDEEAAFE